MAIVKTVHKFERVVPVRFARAPHPTDPTINSGTYDANAPEPDDRGFLPHTTGGAIFPVGLDTTVAAAARPETRVRLIRMDMENAGSLFVTAERPGVFEITLPAANAALPSTKEMMIKLRAVAGGTTNLRVHFGSIAGPVIHQIQVVVNNLIPVRVVAHVPIINGTVVINPLPPPAGAPFPTAQGTAFPTQSSCTDASIRQMFSNANIIFFPYGIKFNLDAVIDRSVAGAPTGTVTLANQGMVAPSNAEFRRVTAINRQARAINAYFVPQIATSAATINSIAGMALSARTVRDRYGLFIVDWTNSFHAIAHEIGHLFNLPNDPTGQMPDHINTRPDAAIPGTGRVIRFDTISRRRLMWAFTRIRLGNSTLEPNRALHNLTFRDDVGYGNDTVGGMLTLKQLNNDKTDKEMAELQRTAAALP